MMIRVARPTAALASLFILLGCASGTSSQKSTGSAAIPHDALAGAIEDIDEFYVKSPDIPSIALAGLQALTSIDPALSVRKDGTELTLLRSGLPIDQASLGQQPSPAAWGDAMEQIVTAAVLHSELLQRQAPGAIEDLVFAGIFSKLDARSAYLSSRILVAGAGPSFDVASPHIALMSQDGRLAVASNSDCVAPMSRSLSYGDIVLQIDGHDTSDMTIQEGMRLLSGAPGTSVTLEIEKAGTGQKTDLALKRQRSRDETQFRFERMGRFEWMQACALTAYFAANLGSELIQQSIPADAPAGYVLDLRGSPGGLLKQTIELADLFLEAGEILRTRGRHPDSLQNFNATLSDRLNGKPLVVLIDRGTASGAEVVAAALQRNGRAVVVGSASGGAGSIQNAFPVAGGGQLFLTWAEMVGPAGAPLSDSAVIPTICTAMAKTNWSDALMGGNADARLFPITAERRTTVNDVQGFQSVRDGCPMVAGSGGEDADLQIALALLRDRDLYQRAIALATQ